MGRHRGQRLHGQTGHSAKKLIQAAVDAVDGNAPAPPELQLAWNCERWKCLPEAGAYLEQEHSLMMRMNVLNNIYGAYSHYRNAHGAQIHSLSESERRILRALKDDGFIFKA